MDLEEKYEEFIKTVIEKVNMIIDHLGNYKIRAEALISLQSLLQQMVETDLEKIVFNDNVFYATYTELMELILDCLKLCEREVQVEICRQLEEKIYSLIIENIIEGLNNGDITEEDLEEK